MSAFAGMRGPFLPELTVIKKRSASETLIVCPSIILTYSFKKSVYWFKATENMFPILP